MDGDVGCPLKCFSLEIKRVVWAGDRFGVTVPVGEPWSSDRVMNDVAEEE